MSDTIDEKHARFAALHQREGAFVVANAWDSGTARVFTQMGFEALATTSAGFAFAAGKRDSFAALGRDEVIANAGEVARATDLPVTADLEDGFGIEPEACAQTIGAAIAVGLVGGSIEDATGHEDAPIYEQALATDRIAAAAEAAQGKPFLVTARAENYLWGRHDLDDTIRRLQSYAAAGADVLYAPGLTDLNDIRTLCREVVKPVNVVMGLVGPSISVDALAEAGVRRISVGGSFARAGYGAIIRAAEEVLEKGTFTYARDAIKSGALMSMMSGEKAGKRG